MNLTQEKPQESTVNPKLQGESNFRSEQTPIRCNFKRVFSADRPELDTTVSTCNASHTLPSHSLTDDSLCTEGEIKRMCVENCQGDGSAVGEEGDDERFSVRFKKTEMSPSALYQKKRLEGKPCLQDLLVLCVINYGGKAVEVGCQVVAGELQFSNGCAFRLNKITKMKVGYEDYQKCLWLTIEDTSKNRIQESKLRLHIHHDIRDDLYLLFAAILLQKLALNGHFADPLQTDDQKQDRFQMTGTLLKKSQFLGKWAERHLVVTDRIESFRNGKCTFAMRNIRQIWTRFDMYQSCLVLKVRHGSEKTELAIPVVNYAARFCRENWLYRIYRLVSVTLT